MKNVKKHTPKTFIPIVSCMRAYESLSDAKASTEGVFISKEDCILLHQYFRDEYIKFAAKDMYLNDVYQETDEDTDDSGLVEEIIQNHSDMIEARRRAQLFGKLDTVYCELAIIDSYEHDDWYNL